MPLPPASAPPETLVAPVTQWDEAISAISPADGDEHADRREGLLPDERLDVGRVLEADPEEHDDEQEEDDDGARVDDDLDGGEEVGRLGDERDRHAEERRDQ